MTPTEHREPPKRRGFWNRFRAMPGSSAALVAFVLTITLGVGGTAAYAWWSQQGNARITATAGAPKPVPTTPAPTPTTPAPTPTTPAPGGVNPILPNIKTAWAGKTADPTCTRVVNKSTPESVSIEFSWPNISTATSYVVSVKSKTTGYTYTQPIQEVGSPRATFVFPENKAAANAAFYTDYLVRIMPMKGSVGGDPTYRTFQHRSNETNNCYYGDMVNSPIGITPLTCTIAGLNNSPTADLKLQWAAAAGASSYRVSVRPGNAPSGYGADLVTAGTSTEFRFDTKAHAGKYVVRVQPMNGNVAGDPSYVTYQLNGPWSHSCGAWNDTFQ